MARLPARLRTWTAARRTVALGFLALLVLGGAADLGPLRGSAAATRLLAFVPFVDPLAALESGLAARHLTETMLVGAGLLVLLALLLGPVFCGWLCPLGLALDLNHAGRAWLRRLVGRAGRPERVPTRPPSDVRYVVLGLLLGVALVLQVPVFQVLSPINLLVGVLVAGAGLGLGLLAAIVLLEWFVPRLWCRSLCPLGALYGLLGRFAPLRVRIDAAIAHRSPCRLCSISCPMGIDVVEGHTRRGKTAVDDASCTRCGACLDVCPRGMLGLGFRRVRSRVAGRWSVPASSPRSGARRPG